MVLRKAQTSPAVPQWRQDTIHMPPDLNQFSRGTGTPYQRYDKLDVDGICMVGERLEPGQPL